MILNHKRISVYDWNTKDESKCPDCEELLIAKRGKIRVWHWAHKRNPMRCYSEETAWHLAWKMSYHRYENWEIEVPIEIDGKRYRIDAMNIHNNKIREFVHSLSDTYIEKHYKIKNMVSKNITWLIDGDKFLQTNLPYRSGNHLIFSLKTDILMEEIGVNNFVVHSETENEWYSYSINAKRWYPKKDESKAICNLLNGYNQYKNQIAKQQNALM